jgi:aspartate/methionine/tyrosine aminotransferase
MKRSRRGNVAPFLAMEMARDAGLMAAEGRRVFRLDVGQPGFPAPASVRRAAALALDQNTLGYTEAMGLPRLRAGLAARYQAKYGLSIDPARFIITTGSSAGFVLAFLALFDEGARIGLATPGYPPYRHILTALGLKPVEMQTRIETGFQPTPNDLAEAGPIDGLILASPANPTGSMIPPDALRSLCEVTRASGTRLISDEIYHGLSHGTEEACALRFDPDAIILSSFSKFFAMTGWRIGWMIVPDALIGSVERLQQNLFICAPSLSQHAALAALEPEAEAEAEVYRIAYRCNRDKLVAALTRLGFGPIAPADGAFYIYAGVEAFGRSATDLAQDWLARYGLAVTPGTDFDAVRGEGFIRFSYAASEADVEGAIKALEHWSGGAN